MLGYQFYLLLSCMILTVSICFFIPDINECNTTGHGCHANATCNNLHGSHFCQCKPGFSGNGTHCTGKQLCCFIIIFIYYCVAWFLFDYLLYFFNIDINECNTTNHGCHINASCTNLIGSHFCTCNLGFSGNGTHCNGILVLYFYLSRFSYIYYYYKLHVTSRLYVQHWFYGRFRVLYN